MRKEMPTSKENYETVIGLEVHLQLSTKSKAFCGDDADFGGEPNTRVSAISLGHPGTLPRLNEKQVEYAVRLGLALGCHIHPARPDRRNLEAGQHPPHTHGRGCWQVHP